jgi:hypothetical protein
MGKVFEQKINKFDGGIINDPRDPKENTARVISNFDILTDFHRMIPYRDSEDGDSAGGTSFKKNFAVGLRTGSTYSLFALGVISGTNRAEILYKGLSTGATFDLSENTWNNTGSHQSSAGATAFDLFVFYKKTGLFYGAKAGTQLWGYNPSTPSFDEDIITTNGGTPFAYTNIAQGLVHSKDDILYIPYDNKIAKNNNASWTNAALTLPTHFVIRSICEYGNYLAIAAAPVSGVGKSVVFLWDRDATLATLSETIDWGEGDLRIIEEIGGVLVGISVIGGTAINLDDRVIFKYVSGNKAIKFMELKGDIGTLANSIPLRKQKIHEKLYFMMAITINGTVREGVWSVGRESGGGFSIIHERTPNNDTALVSGTLWSFIFIGDFLFQAYDSSSTHAVSKSNDQNTYTATSIYESKIFNGGDSSKTKKLIGFTIFTEYLPSGGQVVVKYMKDSDTSFGTTILTHSTQNDIRKSATLDSTGAILPIFKEIQFRLESTGNAVITGFKFKYEEIEDDVY